MAHQINLNRKVLQTFRAGTYSMRKTGQFVYIISIMCIATGLTKHYAGKPLLRYVSDDQPSLSSKSNRKGNLKIEVKEFPDKAHLGEDDSDDHDGTASSAKQAQSLPL